jgi:hypothetical protein
VSTNQAQRLLVACEHHEIDDRCMRAVRQRMSSYRTTGFGLVAIIRQALPIYISINHHIHIYHIHIYHISYISSSEDTCKAHPRTHTHTHTHTHADQPAAARDQASKKMTNDHTESPPHHPPIHWALFTHAASAPRRPTWRTHSNTGTLEPRQTSTGP